MAEKLIYDSGSLPPRFIYEAQGLARYRHLLQYLIARDLKVRYKRSILGFAWTLLNPLLTMIVLTLVFTSLFKRVENYPVYLVAGLMIWRFFQDGISSAMISIESGSGLLTTVYVPPSVFVASTVGGAFVHCMLTVLMMLIIAIPLGVYPKWTWLLLPIPLLQLFIFTFGIGLALAALTVFFLDLLDIVDVFLRAYFYLTPVIYPVAILPLFLQRFQQINPMYQFLNIFRALLIDGAIPSPLVLGVSTLTSIIALLVGWTIFTRLSPKFFYQL